MRAAILAAAILLATPVLSPVLAAEPAPGIRFQAAPDGSGIVVLRGGLAAPEVSADPHGATLLFPERTEIDLRALRRLPGVRRVTSRTGMKDGVRRLSVAIVTTDGSPLHAGQAGGQLLLSPDPVAAKNQKTDGKNGSGGEPSPAELEQLRQSVAGKLAILNAAPAPSVAAALPDPNAAPAAPGGVSFAAAGLPGAAPPAGPARPSCAPIPWKEWRGAGPFPERLVALRASLARAPDDLGALAALAEFQLANGLPQEALQLLEGWADDEAAAPNRARLRRARDIARLMRGWPIDAAAPLLAASPATPPPATSDACEPPERPLWRALQAAAAGDRAGVAAQARHARVPLADLPEPMRTLFAAAIADGANDDPDALRAMVAALRDSRGGTDADRAARWLLQARAARSAHEDEETFLEHAAGFPRTAPGLVARARLAGRRIRHADEAGRRAEAFLADIARTYRHDSLGQEAALLLARQRLAEGHYAAALEQADIAARADRRDGDGGPARFAAQVLRLLLADPKARNLPPDPERMALFWHYGDYAPPGAFGDDIRLAAIRLLLAQGFADSALDTARILSPATLARPEGLLARARAEASAEIGDPKAALALLHAQPDPFKDDAASRAQAAQAASLALARLGRGREAAEAAPSADMEGRSRRAGLFYAASAWPQAAEAYAALLRDPDLGRDARAEAARRYAVAATLAANATSAKAAAGPQSAPPTPEMLAGDRFSARLLSVAAPPAPIPPDAPPVASVRGAIARAHQIETLFGQNSDQPAAP